MGSIIPKSAKCIHSATKEFRAVGFRAYRGFRGFRVWHLSQGLGLGVLKLRLTVFTRERPKSPKVPILEVP